jgi:hypothetical protein
VNKNGAAAPGHVFRKEETVEVHCRSNAHGQENDREVKGWRLGRIRNFRGKDLELLNDCLSLDKYFMIEFDE